jgi:hypothetical protein
MRTRPNLFCVSIALWFSFIFCDADGRRPVLYVSAIRHNLKLASGPAEPFLASLQVCIGGQP